MNNSYFAFMESENARVGSSTSLSHYCTYAISKTFDAQPLL